MRSVTAPADLDAMVGKLPGRRAYDVLLTGPTRVLKPNGDPLCVYLPGSLVDEMAGAYQVLHSLRNERTDNRGDASGTVRLKRGDQTRTRSSLVPSALLGAVDPGGIYPFCRLTAWTGQHPAEWASLRPLLASMDRLLAEHVPDRWQVQSRHADLVRPEWRIPGTVFTTVTVNNTYSTGVHRDAGDLEAGFSTLAVCRRGRYSGAELVLPRYRVAVDMRDGDLLLLDAHEPHGNVPIMGSNPGLDERISVVAYLRSALIDCGDEAAERARADDAADRRSAKGTR